MKKVVVAIVMCTLLFGSTVFAGLTKEVLMDNQGPNGVNSITQTFSFSNISFNEKEEYIEVRAEKGSLMSAGYPILPYAIKVITFPFGTKIEGIEVETGKVMTKQLDKKIMPAPEPVPLNMQNAEIKIKEGEIYESKEAYPSEWVTWHTGAGIEKGKHVIFLSIHAFPCRYIPALNELLYTNEIKIKVKYTPPEKPLMQNDEYDLLIISPSEFSDELQPLVSHKENHGIKTKLVTLNEIYGGTFFTTQGRDDAEKIKYFIKDAIEQWGIKYVLLVGGRHGGLIKEKWWCPVRYSHLDDGGEPGYLSDLYFADIYKYEDGNIVFDDWDSNGNGKFAEWGGTKKDILDLYPDIYVGRLACRNEFEVKNVIEKIIEYENNAYDSEWFKKIVLVGGDSYPHEGDPYYEGEEENKEAMKWTEDFEHITLWTSTGTLSGEQDVIDAVSQGCGFLFFDGHGNPMGWATHPPYDEETWIDGLKVQSMHKLSNDGMYPICVVGGCHNCQFNVSLLNLLKIYEGSEWYRYVYMGETSPESWGWWLVRMAGKGTIATLGYTGYDYFAIGDYDNDSIPDCIQYFSGYLNTRFFRNYGGNDITILGAVHAQTLTDYLNQHFPTSDAIHHKTVQEFVLLGDPSLMIGGYET